MTEEEKLGQEYLERAFDKIHKLYLEENPPIEGEVVYSPKYIKAINKLLGKKETKKIKFFDSIGKRIIAAIVALMLVVGGGIGVYAFREPIVKFITEIKDKFVEIFFCEADVSKAPAEIETVYTLGYVPDGYELESRENMGVKARLIWSNGEDEIVLTQRLLSNNATIDSEKTDFRILYIDELQIITTDKNGSKALYWNNGEYAFELKFTDNISDEECIKIINSLTE